MTNQVEFRKELWHDSTSIVPYVDGKSLAELVTAFEAANDLKPIGGYGGLLTNGFRYGPFDQYFVGLTVDRYWSD